MCLENSHLWLVVWRCFMHNILVAWSWTISGVEVLHPHHFNNLTGTYVLMLIFLNAKLDVSIFHMLTDRKLVCLYGWDSQCLGNVRTMSWMVFANQVVKLRSTAQSGKKGSEDWCKLARSDGGGDAACCGGWQIKEDGEKWWMPDWAWVSPTCQACPT